MLSSLSADFVHMLTMAYVLMGFVALAGYGPQLLVFWKNPLVCQTTPLATWGMWSVQTVVFHAYAWLVNGDGMFILTTGMFMVATVVGLALVMRGRWKARQAVLEEVRMPNVVPMRRAA